MEFDPATRHDPEVFSQAPVVATVVNTMPRGDKITVHVGDVAARTIGDVDLPALDVTVKSDGAKNIKVVWDCEK